MINTQTKASGEIEGVPDGGFIPQNTTSIPNYLTTTYWWAYVSPKAIRFFDREFLVNLILFGNFKKLRDRALDRLGFVIEGKTLQIASEWGDFTKKIVDRLTPESVLDVIDIVPGQLENLKKKLCENSTFSNSVILLDVQQQGSSADSRISVRRSAIRQLGDVGRIRSFSLPQIPQWVARMLLGQRLASQHGTTVFRTRNSLYALPDRNPKDHRRTH